MRLGTLRRGGVLRTVRLIVLCYAVEQTNALSSIGCARGRWQVGAGC
jgi:hypothetical protein